MLWIAQYDSRNFSFLAFGTTRSEAERAMRDGWNLHAQQTGATDTWEQDVREDVTYRPAAYGMALRDGEPIGVHMGVDVTPALAEPEQDTVETAAAPLDLDAVVALVRERGVDAYVDHTGGGVATIYAGPSRIDENGCERWAACAGPGWFDGPGFTNPRAEWTNLAIGPDDDGEAEPFWTSGESTEQVAALIVAQAAEARSTV